MYELSASSQYLLRKRASHLATQKTSAEWVIFF
jgi:hypothetical protein